MGGPELLVPAGLVGPVADAELGVVLGGVGDGDGPLADDDAGCALVAAGGVEIAVFGGSDAGVPFEVAVVVKGGEVGAGEGAGWVSGAPGGVLFVMYLSVCFVLSCRGCDGLKRGIGGLLRRRATNHELDVQTLVVRDTQAALGIADAVPCKRIVGVNHVGRLTGEIARVNGFIDDFEHADRSVGCVGMDALSHPLQEVGCSPIVVLGIETWLRDTLVTTLLIGEDNNIHYIVVRNFHLHGPCIAGSGTALQDHREDP